MFYLVVSLNLLTSLRRATYLQNKYEILTLFCQNNNFDYSFEENYSNHQIQLFEKLV